jgi:hypothetical protein
MPTRVRVASFDMHTLAQSITQTAGGSVTSAAATAYGLAAFWLSLDRAVARELPGDRRVGYLLPLAYFATWPEEWSYWLVTDSRGRACVAYRVSYHAATSVALWTDARTNVSYALQDVGSDRWTTYSAFETLYNDAAAVRALLTAKLASDGAVWTANVAYPTAPSNGSMYGAPAAVRLEGLRPSDGAWVTLFQGSVSRAAYFDAGANDSGRSMRATVAVTDAGFAASALRLTVLAKYSDASAGATYTDLLELRYFGREALTVHDAVWQDAQRWAGPAGEAAWALPMERFCHTAAASAAVCSAAGGGPASGATGVRPQETLISSGVTAYRLGVSAATYGSGAANTTGYTVSIYFTRAEITPAPQNNFLRFQFTFDSRGATLTTYPYIANSWWYGGMVATAGTASYDTSGWEGTYRALTYATADQAYVRDNMWVLLDAVRSQLAAVGYAPVAGSAADAFLTKDPALAALPSYTDYKGRPCRIFTYSPVAGVAAPAASGSADPATLEPAWTRVRFNAAHACDSAAARTAVMTALAARGARWGAEATSYATTLSPTPPSLTAWSTVGSPESAAVRESDHSNATYVGAPATLPDGAPTMCLRTGRNEYRLSVLRYDGTWQRAGGGYASAADVAYPTLASGGGRLYATFRDSSTPSSARGSATYLTYPTP